MAEGERVELSSPFGSSVFGTVAVAICRLDLPYWCRVRDSNPLAQRERLMSHPISHAAFLLAEVKLSASFKEQKKDGPRGPPFLHYLNAKLPLRRGTST